MEAAGRLHFGALLRKLRLDVGITQQELAERAKLSVEAISTLERGARTRPHRETVALLGSALGLTPEREALLESAVGIAHSPRRRERIEARSASLLTVVRSDAQATPKHNLPRQLTSFVGRQREIDEITALLREQSLVTIVGTGGVGKTRVAISLGGDLLNEYPDGVWLVDLAPIADQTLLASAVLAALRLPTVAGSASDALVAHLKARQLLLILDNCEHVITEARAVAGTIVASCRAVCVLATSRQALNAPGERIYRLPSLPFPPDSRANSRDALQYSAVALFIDRAHALDPRFALTDDNAPDVAEICRRLDGMPFAIELAAARVNVLAPHQIAQRLDQRFRLLAGDPAALPRHRTMTALIDWSYDLLTTREQRFFEWLSVFSGGCTLEGATAVCATDAEDDLDIIDLIGSLVAKSLLVAELAGSEQRYRFLESSRQYAGGKLRDRDNQDEVLRRHALYFLDLAERLDLARESPSERDSIAAARADSANWRAVLEWTLGKKGDVAIGQRLAAIRAVTSRVLAKTEGLRWIRVALNLVDERTPPHLVAQLEHARSAATAEIGERTESLAAAERSMALYRQIGDESGLAQAQIWAASSLSMLGKPDEAELLLHDALQTSARLSNRRVQADILWTLATTRLAAGDFSNGRAYYLEAQDLAKVLGAVSLVQSATVGLAETEFASGDAQTALRLTEELLAEPPEYQSLTPVALLNKAAYLVALNRYIEAKETAGQALGLSRSLQMGVLVVVALQHLGVIAVLNSSFTQNRAATLLFGFVESRRIGLGMESYNLQQQYDLALNSLRGALGAEELSRLMALGATMAEEEAINQAHMLG